MMHSCKVDTVAGWLNLSTCTCLLYCKEAGLQCCTSGRCASLLDTLHVPAGTTCRFHFYFLYSTSNSTNLLCAEKNRTAVHVQYEDWSNQQHQDCLCRKKQECCFDAPDQDASTKAKEASRYPRCTGRVQPGIIHSCDNHSAPRVQC